LIKEIPRFPLEERKIINKKKYILVQTNFLYSALAERVASLGMLGSWRGYRGVG